jgi:heme/copper-type cytochrome/quinol oxidase subunit 3
MHGIFQAIQSKFSCATFQKNLQNTSHFVTLFSAHGDVVVGFAIFHIVTFQNEKNEKKKKKRHSSMVCESWWHPMESVNHGL